MVCGLIFCFGVWNTVSLCIIELYYIKKSTQLPYSIELYNELTFLEFIVHKKLASANSMECMFHVSTFIDVASFLKGFILKFQKEKWN